MGYAELESNTKTQNASPREQCGMARAAELIGDRWSLLILREAFHGVTRFDAMQSDLGAPRTILSRRLKKLCENEILQKRPYREPGQRQRHQYVLTSKGVELALPLIALMQWGEKHLLEGASGVKIVDRQTGEPCRVSIVSDAGEPVSLGATQFQQEH